MTTAKELGKRFREAREKSGLSVEEIYVKSRIHKRVINDIENGVFDRLNKLYVKSFLKKYSDFLRLDTGEILEKYELISLEIPDQEYVVEEEERKGTAALIFDEKSLQIVLVAVLSIIFVILVFVFIGKIRGKFVPEREQTAVLEEKNISSRTASTVKGINLEGRQEETPPAIRMTETSEVMSAPIIFTLRAEGEVWVKVKKGRKTLYTGTMRKGDSRTWKSDEAFTVWTGKAERLTFVVNDRDLGTVVSGVVRDIKVSAKGVQIGDRWVSRI